jgi:SulP family sulfate permease
MVEVGDIKSGNDELIAHIAYGDTGNRGSESIRAMNKKDIDVYEISGPFFFGVADMLQNVLRQVAKTPRMLILRMRAVPAVDSTGIAALESFLLQCRYRKIRLILCEVQTQPYKALEKAGFIESVGKENVVSSLEEAYLLY